MINAEQRIDEMMSTGQRVIAEAVDYVSNCGKKIFGIIAAFSGGDDSIVVTHFANSVLQECITFNADTLIGLTPTRRHIEHVIAKHGWTTEIIKAEAEGPPKRTATNSAVVDNWREGATAYEEFVLNHGFTGPAMHARMYQRLKERPLLRLRRRLSGGDKGGRLVVISGIRRDESAIRAGYKRSWADCPKTGTTWVNPFYDFTAADFDLYRQEFGLQRNPVKRKCGISGECCCGAFGSRDERAAYKEVDPEFCMYLDRLETKVRERFPWNWGESPPKWWRDQKAGQGFFWPMLTDEEMPTFQPMCVGCNSGRR